MARPTPPEGRILLVEGQDDKHVIWQICQRRTPSFAPTRQGPVMRVALSVSGNEFLISERDSRGAVISAIRQEVTAPGRLAVGVVVDADADPISCWAEVTRGFSRTPVALPDDPDYAGLVLSEQLGQPRVGVWMMPDNRSPGELEDFVRQMIPPAAPVWAEAQRYIDDILPEDRKFAPEKTDKAKLYAWLATLKEPARMGAAISDGDLQTDGPLCQTFAGWLQRLFG